jgi:hypothetical protein
LALKAITPKIEIKDGQVSKRKDGKFSGKPMIGVRLDNDAMNATEAAAKDAKKHKTEYARDVLIAELKRAGYLKD